MKRVFIVALFLLIAIESHSTSIPLDSIKADLVSFLNKVEKRNCSINELPDFLIFDRGKKEAINDGKDGIFVFGILSSGARTHYLLVDQNSFQILDMTESLDINLLKLIHFFEWNKQYNRNDILFYINDLIITYQRNEEYIKSFNGL